LSEVSLVEVADTTLGTPEDTTYAYDLLGNLDLQILPNGIITDYIYNDVSQFTVESAFAHVLATRSASRG